MSPFGMTRSGQDSGSGTQLNCQSMRAAGTIVTANGMVDVHC
jgi:hypothetical protein